MVAVSDPDKEGIGDRHRIYLNIDVDFDVPAVLFVGVGDQMNPGNVSEGGFVIRVDSVNLEAVFKNLAVHQLTIIIAINQLKYRVELSNKSLLAYLRF